MDEDKDLFRDKIIVPSEILFAGFAHYDFIQSLQGDIIITVYISPE